MRISLKGQQEKPKCTFGHITSGSWFALGLVQGQIDLSAVYTKIRWYPPVVSPGDSCFPPNAVHCVSGEACYFGNDKVVIPLDAELVVALR